jgi:hypothetical protein
LCHFFIAAFFAFCSLKRLLLFLQGKQVIKFADHFRKSLRGVSSSQLQQGFDSVWTARFGASAARRFAAASSDCSSFGEIALREGLTLVLGDPQAELGVMGAGEAPGMANVAAARESRDE